MAVVSCELVNPRSVTTSIDGKRQYELEYRIYTDTRKEFAGTVLAQARTASPNPIPLEGATLNSANTGSVSDSGVNCLSVRLRQDDIDEQTRWTATATMGQLPENKSPLDLRENPLERPPRFWTENIEELEPISEYYDAAGKKQILRNGAGQEFIDPVMQERSYPVLVIQKNLDNLQQIIDWNLEFEASVNSEEYQGGAKRTVRFLPIQSGQITFENGVSYYPAVFRFAYKHDTWDRRIVNQGFHHINTEGKLVRAKDKEKANMVEPVLLLEDGKLANTNTLGLPTNPEDSVLVRNTRPLKDFGDLEL